MKRFAFASVFAAALLAFTLVGCSGSNESGEASGSAVKEQTSSETIVGYWRLDPDASVVIDAFLHIESDGGAEFVAGDSYYEGTWTVEDGTATASFEDAEPVKLSFDGEKLWMGGSDSSRLVFQKTDDNAVKHEVSDLKGAGASADAGSGGSGDSAEPSGESDDLEVVDEVFTDIDPVVVADDATCTITVTAKGTDFTGDPCYRLDIVNKTDKALYVTAEEPFTVGGKTVDAGLGDSVDPGETIDATMFFAKEDLGGTLDLLVDVTGTINIEEDDTFAPVADYPFHMD